MACVEFRREVGAEVGILSWYWEATGILWCLKPSAGNVHGRRRGQRRGHRESREKTEWGVPRGRASLWGQRDSSGLLRAAGRWRRCGRRTSDCFDGSEDTAVLHEQSVAGRWAETPPRMGSGRRCRAPPARGSERSCTSRGAQVALKPRRQMRRLFPGPWPQTAQGHDPSEEGVHAWTPQLPSSLPQDHFST